MQFLLAFTFLRWVSWKENQKHSLLEMAPLVTGAQWQHLLGAAGLCQPAAGLGVDGRWQGQNPPPPLPIPMASLGCFSHMEYSWNYYNLHCFCWAWARTTVPPLSFYPVQCLWCKQKPKKAISHRSKPPALTGTIKCPEGHLSLITSSTNSVLFFWHWSSAVNGVRTTNASHGTRHAGCFLLKHFAVVLIEVLCGWGYTRYSS